MYSLPMQQRGFVRTDGEEIYFQEWGDGPETVILGHGLGGSHAVWYQQVVYLAQQYRVVTWDQRGFGRSTRHGDVGPVPAASDLRAVLDHLGVQQAHVIGQSMGGWSALGFAIAHPDRVLSLTLADTTAGIFNEEIFQALLDYGMEIADSPPPEQWPLGDHPAVGTQLAGQDLAHSFLYTQLGTLTTPPPPAEIMPLLMGTDHTAGCPGVTSPTLFIVGENDPIFPPHLIETAASFISGSSVVVIPDTGHSPYFERPSLWNSAVGSFLQQSTE